MVNRRYYYFRSSLIRYIVFLAQAADIVDILIASCSCFRLTTRPSSVNALVLEEDILIFAGLEQSFPAQISAD